MRLSVNINSHNRLKGTLLCVFYKIFYAIKYNKIIMLGLTLIAINIGYLILYTTLSKYLFRQNEPKQSYPIGQAKVTPSNECTCNFIGVF